ncbi:MAG TPA: DUF2784 domain-containing protein [Gemmatimonadales bacterium]|nr:DUF2784 domain-containing protein [Gemmatimonadales bacterium]
MALPSGFYGVLADAVVVLHLGFVLFVVLGGLLVLRWRWVMWLHLPAAVWGALIEFAGWICPLTPLEKWLRRQGGLGGYEGGFIEHYILPVLYPRDLTRTVQLALGTAVIVVNLIIYWRVYRRAQRVHDST